jgi:hypothetical protein
LRAFTALADRLPTPSVHSIAKSRTVGQFVLA